MSTAKKKYYKVVNNVNMSVMAYKNAELCVFYKEMEWAYPRVNGTKLMVFDSLERAKHYDGRIYECEVKNPQRRGFFVNGTWNTTYLHDCFIEALDKKTKKKKYLTGEEIIPHGTVFCDAVMITKRVR